MKKKINPFLITVTLGIPVGIAAGYGAIKLMDYIDDQQIANIKKELGDTYDYLKTNKKGRPIKLDIKDNCLAVILNQSFSEEAKKNACYALNELDEILPNTKINIYKDGNRPENDNYISIDVVDAIKGNESAIGECTISYKEKSATVIYPVKIEIEKDYMDQYFMDDLSKTNEELKVPSNSAFTHIVQHEVMHAFGFRDLYKNDKGFNDSVMAYAITYGTKTYSDLDKYHLQYLYEDKNATYKVTATLPNQMLVSYLPSKEHEEELEM